MAILPLPSQHCSATTVHIAVLVRTNTLAFALRRARSLMYLNMYWYHDYYDYSSSYYYHGYFYYHDYYYYYYHDYYCFLFIMLRNHWCTALALALVAVHVAQRLIYLYMYWYHDYYENSSYYYYHDYYYHGYYSLC